MIPLSKILPWFVLPLGVALILLCWALVRRSRRALWGAIVVLLVFSNPLIGRALIRACEGWAERRPVSSVPVADAIVVLSAGRIVAPGPDRISEWTDANRFFGGMSLFREGRAPLLVFTGGWTIGDPGAIPEGQVLADVAQSLGIARDRIIVTGRVISTAAEAEAVASLLKPRVSGTPRIVLVTSAFHMARARQLFSRQGLDIEPFPVDFAGASSNPISLFDFIPALSALSQSETAIRELYGRAYYAMFSPTSTP